MQETNDKRLWAALESINQKLGDIDKRLVDVVRIEERITNHGGMLTQYGEHLSETDRRLREVELILASEDFKALNTKVDSLGKRADSLTEILNVNKGQKDTTKEVLKWVTGILASILVGITLYIIKKG